MNMPAIFPQQLLLTYRPRTTRNRKPTTKPRRAKRFKHVYISVNELGRHVGCEFTFIPGGFTKEEAPCMDSLARGLVRPFKTRLDPLKVKTYKGVTCDPQCIEVPISKTNKRKAFRHAATSLHAVAKSLGMVGHTDWHGGGGAHIHIGMKTGPATGWKGAPLIDPALKVLLLDATNRPYINWAFSNPADMDNTRTTATLLRKMGDEVKTLEQLHAEREQILKDINMQLVAYVKYAEHYRQYAAKRDTWDYAKRRAYVCQELRNDEGRYLMRYRKKLIALNKQIKAYVPATTTVCPEEAYNFLLSYMDKSYGITPRQDKGTLEFRIFQAPNDPKEHDLHLNFALAYVEWAEAQAKVGKVPQPVIMTAAELKAYPLDKAKKQFIKFVGMIGLKTRPYRRYLKNMERRYALVAEGNAKLN